SEELDLRHVVQKFAIIESVAKLIEQPSQMAAIRCDDSSRFREKARLLCLLGGLGADHDVGAAPFVGGFRSRLTGELARQLVQSGTRLFVWRIHGSTVSCEGPCSRDTG